MIKVHYDKDQYSLIGHKEDWCMANLGKGIWGHPEHWGDRGWPPFVEWAVNSAFGNSFFYFKEEKDATLFILRWGPGV